MALAIAPAITEAMAFAIARAMRLPMAQGTAPSNGQAKPLPIPMAEALPIVTTGPNGKVPSSVFTTTTDRTACANPAVMKTMERR